MDVKPLGQPQPLNRAAAHNAVTRLNAALSPAIRDLAHRLLNLLGDDGSVSVAEVHQQLFPLANARTGSAQFSNLLAAIKKAAEAQGLTLDWGFEGSKQAGTAKRKFHFLGPRAAHLADLEGLERIPLEQRIDGQRGRVLGETPCVILLTFNQHEYEAVRAAFWQPTASQSEPATDTREGLVVDVLSPLGRLRVLHHHSRQGNRESQRAATALERHFSPQAILAVGVAFGIDESRQALGDVLVSQFIVDYELGKVGRGGALSLRGSRPPASRRLLEALRQIDARRNASAHHPDWPALHFGGLLSGEKLVDNLDYREALRELHGGDDLVGGEMEAAGLFTALDGKHADWIVIKAICDWADGHKSQDKTRRQKLASANAAAVAKALLTKGGLYPEAQAPKPPLKPALSEFAASHPFAEGQKGRQTDLDSLRSRLRSPRDLAEQGGGVVAMDDLLNWTRSEEGPLLYALLAEYGMGKTTHCQRLYDTLRRARAEGHNERAPLYFDLRKVERLQAATAASPGITPSLQEVIEDCLRHGYLQPDGQAPRYEDALDEIDQGALVIFDGLDEVLSRIGDKQGLSFVANLLKVIPETVARGRAARQPKVLLSCRTQFFRNLTEQNNQLTGGHRGARDAPQFRALELLPFEDEQIRAYLAALFPDGKIDALMAQIEAIHNLRELTERPFTLKLVGQFIPLVEGWRAQGRTITGATLYRQIAREWLIRDREKQSFQPEDKERIAADLAAHLWRKNLRGLPARDLEAWLSQWLAAQDPHADFQRLERSLLQQDLRNATFLRRVDRRDDSRFEFAHSSLQEFFLAEYLRLAVVEATVDPTRAAAARQRWALREVSPETLDFLGQMLAEASEPGTAALLATLAGWRAPYLAQASERLLDYAVAAYQAGWPRPRLDGVDFQGADLSDRHIGSVGEEPLHSLQCLDLRNANFTGARLRRTCFWNVNLAQARFDGALATQAEFQHCNLRGSHWVAADTTGALCRPLDRTPWQPTAPTAPSAAARLLPVLGGPGPLGTQSISTNGRWLATGGSCLRLWDTQNGDCLRVLTGHDGWVSACAIAPDGHWIASASYDGTLRLWDAHSGDCLRVLAGHESSVTACAVAPDGRWIASAGDDGTLRLWDAHSGDCLRVLAGHEDCVDACAIAPDGHWIASAGHDGTLRLWDAHSGARLRQLAGHEGTVSACAIAPDGRWIASVAIDRSLRLWDVHSGDCLRVLTGHKGAVTACAVAPDGRWIACAGRDRTLRLWDVHSGDCLRVLAGHEDWVTACAIAPDGHRIASASYDGTLRLWDARTGDCLRVLAGHEGRITACAIASDGLWIASTGDDGTVRRHSLQNPEDDWAALCSRQGSATWRPNEGSLSEARGDAWRYLRWQSSDAQGWPQTAPLEAKPGLQLKPWPPQLGNHPDAPR